MRTMKDVKTEYVILHKDRKSETFNIEAMTFTEDADGNIVMNVTISRRALVYFRKFVLKELNDGDYFKN